MPSSTEPPLPAAFYESRMLSFKQTEEMLGVKKAKLFKLMNDKNDPLPSYKIGGSRKFKLDTVIWWIEKQAQ